MIYLSAISYINGSSNAKNEIRTFQSTNIHPTGIIGRTMDPKLQQSQDVTDTVTYTFSSIDNISFSASMFDTVLLLQCCTDTVPGMPKMKSPCSTAQIYIQPAFLVNCQIQIYSNPNMGQIWVLLLMDPDALVNVCFRWGGRKRTVRKMYTFTHRVIYPYISKGISNPDISF